MNNLVFPLPEQEDSPDLTDAQIAGALKLGPIDMGGHVEDSRCPTCNQRGLGLKFAVRRRKPHMYMVVSQTCPLNHSWELVFEADWIERT